jgi:hypothetical protein
MKTVHGHAELHNKHTFVYSVLFLTWKREDFFTDSYQDNYLRGERKGYQLELYTLKQTKIQMSVISRYMFLVY